MTFQESNVAEQGGDYCSLIEPITHAKKQSKKPHLRLVPVNTPEPGISTDAVALESLLNQIFNEDCLEFLAKAKACQLSPQLIFTDPPYNLSGKSLVNNNNKTGGAFHKVNEDWDFMPPAEYLSFTKKWMKGCYDIQPEGGVIYICGSHHNIGEMLVTAKEVGYKVQNLITWAKRNPMPSQTRRTFTHSSEFILIATKGAGWVFNYEDLKLINDEQAKDGTTRAMRDVWSIGQCQGKERIKGTNGRSAHPTQKPELIVERAITASCKPGDLVLDIFSGSGTTQSVAKKLGRNFSGCEKDIEYFKVATLRLQS